eukprot:CAMPEP_0176360888 /NCGR_PEP_ID=MMETSP0126-20121128/17367_1 /TAXON_ID=141414 ORGANISM="Strombidinopsis acuminatum, Strain SPMC142" /NCGR_SAMPLE_ID=MMETSP0126 /ASSEMBLY_ACC=CAM_ASM_000229 /LENGTH=31 /DNA_ID= /DNA_START= /DNA_END= /DNA_ORIENTATION=
MTTQNSTLTTILIENQMQVITLLREISQLYD